MLSVQGNAKVFPCLSCAKYIHTTYGGLETTTQQGSGTQIKRCRTCSGEPALLDKTSLRTNLRRFLFVNSARNESQASLEKDNSFYQILEKLMGLDEVKDRFTKIEGSDTKSDDIGTTVSSIQKSLKVGRRSSKFWIK